MEILLCKDIGCEANNPPPPLTCLLVIAASSHKLRPRLFERNTAISRRPSCPASLLVPPILLATSLIVGCAERVEQTVPPAPVFRSQPIVVELGLSGKTLTLMTTPSGGVTLDGKGISSENAHTTADGNVYILTLVDGRWQATYQPAQQQALLGHLDESVLLVRAENGDWLYDEHPVVSGESTVTASNGSVFVLTQAEGLWHGIYRVETQKVRLGISGQSAILVRAEHGDWLYGERPVVSGESTVISSNGSVYVLALTNGRWLANYRTAQQTLPLGGLGESVVLDRLESGDWLLDGDLVASGETSVEASNGSVFTLVRSSHDRWSAHYQIMAVEVPLGESGRLVTLERAVDATWRLGPERVVSGETLVTADESLWGRTIFYRLARTDGQWTAIPTALQIVNAATRQGLAGAFERGNRTGYELDGASGVLDAQGTGKILVTAEDGTSVDYRVWKEADELLAFRHDTMSVATHYGRAPALVEDDPATPYNESGTVLEVGGGRFPIGELLELGQSTSVAGSMVEPMRAILANVLTNLALLTQTTSPGDPSGESLRMQKVAQWKVANEAIGPLDLGPEALGAFEFRSKADDETAVAKLEAAVAALADSKSFAEAVDVGLFGEAALEGSYDPARAHAATRQSWSLKFGTTQSTRFGAWGGVIRETALGEASLFGFGAFAYTPAPSDHASARQLRGSAIYEGRTVAVSSETEPEYFHGDVRLIAHFGRRAVMGQVWNLVDRQGQPWSDGTGGVLGIVLPDAALDSTGAFSSPAGRSATLLYVKADGYRPKAQLRSSIWQGLFIDGQDRSQPGAAIGTYEVAAAEDLSGLRGGFGAEWEKRIVLGSSQSSDPISSDPTSSSCSGDCGQNLTTPMLKHYPHLDGIIPTADKATATLTLQTIRGPRKTGVKPALNATGWMEVDLARAWATGRYSQSSDISLVEEVKRQLRIYRSNIAAVTHHISIKDLWHPAIAQLNRLGIKNISPESNYEYSDGSPRVPLEDPQDTSKVDKDAALSKLDDAVEALGTLSAFQATLTNTQLFEFESGTDSADIAVAFAATQQNRNQVYYAHTDYTRFGIWTHRIRDSTSTGAFSLESLNSSLGFESFAYSPLAGTLYDSHNGGQGPAFPVSGTAVYNGKTIAGNMSTGAVKPPYQGEIELRVFWAEPDGTERSPSELDDIRVGASITNLVDSGGVPWNDGWGNVKVIEFDRNFGPNVTDGTHTDGWNAIRERGENLAPDPILPGGKMNRVWFSKKAGEGQQLITRYPTERLPAGLLKDPDGTLTRQIIADNLAVTDPLLKNLHILVNITYEAGSYDSTKVPSGRSIATGHLAGEFLGGLKVGPGALIGSWTVLPNRFLPNDTTNTLAVGITDEPGVDQLLSWAKEYNSAATTPNRKERLGINFAILEGWTAHRLSSFMGGRVDQFGYDTDSAIHGVYGADLTEYLNDSFPDP